MGSFGNHFIQEIVKSKVYFSMMKRPISRRSHYKVWPLFDSTFQDYTLDAAVFILVFFFIISLGPMVSMLARKRTIVVAQMPHVSKGSTGHESVGMNHEIGNGTIETG